jgi:hypothetical protein
MDEYVKISLPIDHLDPNNVAVYRSDGEPMSGKVNPITGLIEFYVRASGLYTPMVVDVDYSDIRSMSNEVRQTVNYVTSRGFMTARSEANWGFAPNEPITLAEFSMALTRAMGLYDPRLDGGFADVSRSDWYFGAAGAVRRHRLITSFENNMFNGDAPVSVNLALVMSVSALMSQMGYRFPINDDIYLQRLGGARYTVPYWSESFIALAVREGLLDTAQMGTMNANTNLTRRDAAEIISRVYERVW